ncbi:DUF2790 domain-containing protein [Pseudomonas abietaniphila]|uniref:DUF2790 domain-containing protein n=1 Tax=Pseudomonas abietaniphila TaxID=89065 RepID=UPI0007802912|nr:DUF2790 domain-containing protein [Pseudomonas abietaniphila]
MYKSFLIAALTFTGFAAHAADQIPVEHYRYGTELDIAKVISQTAPDEFKDVSTVQMTYADSKGVVHVVEYEVVGTGHTG